MNKTSYWYQLTSSAAKFRSTYFKYLKLLIFLVSFCILGLVLFFSLQKNTTLEVFPDAILTAHLPYGLNEAQDTFALPVYPATSPVTFTLTLKPDSQSHAPLIHFKSPQVYAAEDETLAENTIQTGDTTITTNISYGPSEIDASDNVTLQAQEGSDGSVRITLKPVFDSSFIPGEYHLTIALEAEGKTREITQNFLWGVLAVNSNKSIYRPGEKASFSLAVLDEKGEMVCDADVVLEITDPNNKKKMLTTEDDTIRVNPECKLKSYTSVPDFEADYTVSGPGTYTITLSAKTKNGVYRIVDTFKVEEFPVFEVERKSATRIYPPVSYPVVIEVKFNRDFEGVVEEKAPESFYITDHEGADFYEKTEKGQKTFFWKVSAKKGEVKTIQYNYKAPDTSPYFYLLGPLRLRSGQNSNTLVFEESRQWQIAADVPDVTGMMVYGEDFDAGGTITPHYRAWSGTDLGSEGDLQAPEALHGKLNYVVLKSDPVTNSVEKIFAGLTDGGHLDVQVWNGTQWINGTGNSGDGDFATNIATGYYYRCFDVAYEQLSGEAIVVYENSSTADRTIKYRVWSGSSWGTEQTIDFSGITNSANITVQWVKMEARYGSNDIVLGFSGDATNKDIYAYIWNGTTNSFGNGALIGDNTVSQPASENFDVAWETNSGHAMIAFGGSSAALYSTWEGAGWSAAATATNMSNATSHVVLDSDPTSDYIASAIKDIQSSHDMEVDMWNGSDWTTITAPGWEGGIVSENARIASVAWERTGGECLFVFSDVRATSFSYFIFRRSTGDYVNPARSNDPILDTENAPGSGGPEDYTTVSWADDVGQFQLVPSMSDDKIMLTAINVVSLDIVPESVLWEGSSNTWVTQTATMGAFEDDLSPGTFFNPISEAYMFAWDAPKKMEVSGYVYTDEAGTPTAYDCSANNLTVGVAVNGGTTATGTCTENTGAYTVYADFPASAADPVVVFIDGSETPKATTATLAVDTTSNIAINLVTDRVIVSHEGVTSMTNVKLGTGDNGNAGIRYAISGSDLTVDSGMELHVYTGKTFVPGGSVTTQGTGGHLHLDDSATYTTAASQTHAIADSVTIDSSATFTANSSAGLTIGGNFTNNGTFTHNNGTVTFNDATKTSVLNGSGTPAITFYNFTSTTAGKTIQFTTGKTFKIEGAFTVTGSSGNLISIESTTTTPWLIDHQGIEDVTYADINYSGCAVGTTDVTLTSTDTGANNESCWVFPASYPNVRIEGNMRIKGNTRID